MYKIIRTKKALDKYFTFDTENPNDPKFKATKFASIEIRKWYNPMRLFFGDFYYKII